MASDEVSTLVIHFTAIRFVLQASPDGILKTGEV